MASRAAPGAAPGGGASRGRGHRPTKDVDGVTFASFASTALGGTGFESCTPGGIMRLLDHHREPVEGAHAVVIGRSPILGKPAGMLLLARHATVTYCHSRTRHLPEHVRAADIVFAAVGIPSFVRALRFASEGVLCSRTAGGEWALQRGIEQDLVRRAMAGRVDGAGSPLTPDAKRWILEQASELEALL